MTIIKTGLIAACVAGALAMLACQPSESAPATQRVGTIAHKAITECSGVVASRRYPGVYWVHNDSGNAPAIFAINREGALVAEFRVTAKNQDWEDIAIDDEGHLYIGQIGNNQANKESARVLRIEEPDPNTTTSRRSKRLQVDKTWELTYPDQPFDSEGLFIHKGYGYMVSKTSKRRPAALYSFPLEAGEGPIKLQLVTELPIRSPVTGADLSADGTRLALVSEAGLYVFRIDGDMAKAGTVRPMHFPLRSPHDVEGCCFAPGGVLATSESREIYFWADEVLNGGGTR